MIGRIELPGYAVTVGHGLLAQAAALIESAAPGHRFAIITDDIVRPLYGEQLAQQFGGRASLFSIPAGELHKTRERWISLTDALLDAGFARDTTIVALGGGVIGDLAGFVAATFMRGVPVVQMPTTLLAMIDASIGGKTGVDVAAGKNLVGAFHRPAAVIADLDVLKTLPARHWRAGLAEAIKHGVIADAMYFDWIVSSLPDLTATGGPTSPQVTGLVTRSIAIKAEVVRADETERGRRQVLNFGHTLGHAVEAASSYTLLHGEAVAIGMVLESELAERSGVAESGTADRVRHAIGRAQLPVALPEGVDAREVLRLILGDKKARGGVTRYALPARIGAMAAEAEGWTLPLDDALVRERLVPGT